MRPVLALELSTDGILLHELSYDGVWRRIAAAALDDPFLPKRMQDMRATAKASQGRFFKNQIWLPPEQVEGIEVKLTEVEPEDRQAEAEAIIRSTPEFAGRDFAVQVGKEDANGNTQIAVIERQIMQEAQRFANGYGFGSDGFTSSTRIAGFFQQPYFDLAGPAKASVDFRKIGYILGFVMLLAGLVAGGYWAYNNIDFTSDPSVAIHATDTRIFTPTEDPRAPIRPTATMVVNAQNLTFELTSNQIPAQNPSVGTINENFTAQVTQLSLTSSTDMALPPERMTASAPVNTPNASPSRAKATPTDDMPAPETSGFTVMESQLAAITFPHGETNFPGGRPLITYQQRIPNDTFDITPRLTDVLPRDDSTVVMSAQLRKLNESLGLTQVRDNNAAAARSIRTAELQNLRANVTFGRPDVLPILRGGVPVPDVVVAPLVVAPVVIAPVLVEIVAEPTLSTRNIFDLQRLPPVVTTGLPALTPMLRSGTNVADLPDDPVIELVEITPETPIETVVSEEPVVMFTEIISGLTTEQLQRIPPRIFTGRPDVLPILRGGIEVGAEPVTLPKPVDPAVEIARIAALQALSPVVQSGRPQVLPTLRGGIEIGAAPVVVPDPIDPTIEATRIATLQAAAPNVLTGRPAQLPLLRGGATIEGGSGVIVEAPAIVITDAARFRPLFRPASIEVIAVLNDPALSQAAVTNSLAPMHRGPGFAARVEAMAEAVAEAARTTPTFTDTPREVSLPTSANVAREATIEGGINLRATSLIGVYGKPSEYRALIRERGGKYTFVTVGDKLNGWTITTIEESQLRMTKGSRTELLKMPAER